MAAEYPSLRDLARSLNISHTTISDALKGHPKVNPATRERILKAAESAGYRRNPLATALMSEMRRSRSHDFRGVIGILDLRDSCASTPGADRFHSSLVAGAHQRASELGFETNTIRIPASTFIQEELEAALEENRIRGLVVLPFCGGVDLTGLPWHKYASVYLDYMIEKPRLNSCCSDHYRSMFTAMEKLQALGYTRPGFVMESQHDERILFRWGAAYNAFVVHQPAIARVPALIVNGLNAAKFRHWFEEYAPDVVLGHRSTAIMGWMEDCGAKVPETHGFCCLNVTSSDLPCAGIDLQPGLLAARAVEQVIAQLFRSEFGVPGVAAVTTMPAVWSDGPTIKCGRVQVPGPARA